ncbi:hypothetical protein P7K49_027515 [Saguinus oedipus]|uniref:Uncharacterized protein n=1 Tax=Saguinus oedipus TaxID=9490 RepID=A0ABQ9U9Q5_SAGOE|nr:hypothetical protein P7K49_027515 [Saguinus oedipus]
MNERLCELQGMDQPLGKYPSPACSVLNSGPFGDKKQLIERGRCERAELRFLCWVLGDDQLGTEIIREADFQGKMKWPV